MIIFWPQGALSSVVPSGARWGATYSDKLGNTFLLRPGEETVAWADTRVHAVQFKPDSALLY